MIPFNTEKLEEGLNLNFRKNKKNKYKFAIQKIASIKKGFNSPTIIMPGRKIITEIKYNFLNEISVNKTKINGKINAMGSTLFLERSAKVKYTNTNIIDLTLPSI
jgi:hypothetical protein